MYFLKHSSKLIIAFLLISNIIAKAQFIDCHLQPFVCNLNNGYKASLSSTGWGVTGSMTFLKREQDNRCHFVVDYNISGYTGYKLIAPDGEIIDIPESPDNVNNLIKIEVYYGFLFYSKTSSTSSERDVIDCPRRSSSNGFVDISRSSEYFDQYGFFKKNQFSDQQLFSEIKTNNVTCNLLPQYYEIQKFFNPYVKEHRDKQKNAELEVERKKQEEQQKKIAEDQKKEEEAKKAEQARKLEETKKAELKKTAENQKIKQEEEKLKNQKSAKVAEKANEGSEKNKAGAKTEKKSQASTKESDETHSDSYEDIEARLAREREEEMARSGILKAAQTFDLFMQSHLQQQRFNKSIEAIKNFNDGSITSPSQLVYEYKEALAQLKAEIVIETNRRQADIQNMVNIQNQNANAAEAGMMQLGGVIAQHSAEQKLRQKQFELEQEMKKKFETELTELKNELVDNNDSRKYDFQRRVIYAMSEEDEQFALVRANYYKCYNDHINDYFSKSDESLRWVNNDCELPNTLNNMGSQDDEFINSNNLANHAKRKHALLSNPIMQSVKNALQERVEYLADKSIGYDSENEYAHHVRATVHSDIIEKMISAKKALKLNSSNRNLNTYLNVRQDFNAIVPTVIEKENLPQLENIFIPFFEEDLDSIKNQYYLKLAIQNNKLSSLTHLFNSGLFSNLNKHDLLYIAMDSDAPQSYNALLKEVTYTPFQEFLFSDTLYSNYLIIAVQRNAFQCFKSVVEKKNTDLTRVFEIVRAQYHNEVSTRLSQFCISYALQSGDISNLTLVHQDYPVVSALTYGDEPIISYCIKNNNVSFLNYILKKEGAITFPTNTIDLARNKEMISLINTINPQTFNQTDANGNTILHKAIMADDVSKVKEFVASGIVFNTPNYDGWTPLQLATKYNKIEICNILLSSPKTDVNKTGSFGWTALHYAARENNVRLAEILIANNADKYAKDKWGRRPYRVAKERKYPVASLLK